ncbi:hypothetical protein [Micromonospora sp. DH14]|uniref:hypothetical protein n=1 Tax=Micromonospora sp. DH14 TaxID=3040120 RepID=UPI002441C265|nr:hypothetical protein [Micromonospora sp. DH14]MDG9674856.1 hypothetical protein [Micromonospora sp. DH14]
MPDLIDDVARLLHPPPLLRLDADDAEREATEHYRQDVDAAREGTAAQLRTLAERHDIDPLLHALAEQVRVRDEAERHIRLLVGYARECVAPRPYTLEALAGAMHASTSTVRGVFDHQDIEQVTSLTGRRSTVVQSPADEATRQRLIVALEDRTREPARAHVAGVAAALHDLGFTAYPPVSRTANPKHGRQYIRHERRWPNGTVISLYQEPAGFVAVHGHMAEDDPRWYSQLYGIADDGELVSAADVAESLAAYVERLTRYDADKVTR